MPKIVADLRALAANQANKDEAQLRELARLLAERLDGSDSGTLPDLALELLRRYLVDRALLEATTLIDTEGDPEHGIQPFRDSLIYSLGLTVMGRLLDASIAGGKKPMDANPAGVMEVLERAYARVNSTMDVG